MKLRKPNSDIKKAGLIPSDLIKLISEEIKREFSDFMVDKELLISGYIFLEEVYVSIGFKEKKAVRQYNFEASLDFDAEKSKALDKINFGVDAINSMIEAYIEAEKGSGDGIQMPFDWKSFDLGVDTVFLRYNTINTELEKLADDFLGGAHVESDPKLDDPDFDPEILLQ